ncbi:hypothetical protein HMPREF9444_00860 [Succinatimonas hippei YIT 12066]|uniref:Uncharacterized protein n=1 Tax=Succinatimonas hippei (strain DSM 22608 / JCM 16073 / KCTC 15190 / YIT 12066) TaxID=762983 RepID=E8LJI1_SUCHY|nr:hypothetical protein HMPREF9444_00860 [Succinatimonas hippei YIT 12066]
MFLKITLKTFAYHTQSLAYFIMQIIIFNEIPRKISDFYQNKKHQIRVSYLSFLNKNIKSNRP